MEKREVRQGRIEDFKLGGGTLKKIAQSGGVVARTSNTLNITSFLIF
jgi:hypothetical protein